VLDRSIAAFVVLHVLIELMDTFCIKTRLARLKLVPKALLRTKKTYELIEHRLAKHALDQRTLIALHELQAQNV
jgi:hypothetical protein